MLCPSHLQISVTRIFSIHQLNTPVHIIGSISIFFRRHCGITYFSYNFLPLSCTSISSSSFVQYILISIFPFFPAIHQFHVQLHSPQEAVKQTLVLYKHKSHHQNHILPEKNFHGQSVEDGCMPEYWIFQ